MCLFGGLTGNLGPIDFLFGLPINLIVNGGQNKFEVDILKNVAKIANLRPKIGQIPLLSLILKCLFLRAKSNGVQIRAISPRPHMGKIVRMDPKPA